LVEAGESVAVDPVASAVRRAGELLDDGDVREARELVTGVLDAGGTRAVLLWTLADVEFADGDLVVGQALLAEAVDESGQHAAAVARQLHVLSRNGLWRDGLLTAEEIPANLRHDPLVRAEAGDFYRSCGCRAHASECYGPPDGLRRSARAARRWCRLRSGGPFALIRRKIRSREETNLLSKLRQGRSDTRLLGKVGLDERQAQRSRIKVETLHYRLIRLSYGWGAAARAGYRLIPAVILMMWLVLLAVTYAGGFASGLADTAEAAACSASIAAAFVVLVVVILVKHDLRPRFRLRVSTRIFIVYFFVVGVLESAAGEGYDRHILPIAGWRAWIVLGLIVMPAAIACLPAGGMIGFGLWRWRVRRLAREDCLLVVLDILLSTLDYLRSETGYRTISDRLARARELEYAARCLTRDLLPSRTTTYLGSGDWLVQRTAGWAEALIHMQRQIVASIPAGQTKLEALLIHEIRCLATNDLGTLAWRQPPPPLPRRTVLRRQAITVVRTILVAGLPLAVVLITQQFLHVGPGVFGWSRITTGIWALLYVMLSLDPAIRDKIDAAHEIAGLLHTTSQQPR
jgi:hypothetical protein